MNTQQTQTLPMFPTPYPQESFYSVLCRYHVRSCNRTDQDTREQLFGYKTSTISSTLLTPFRLSRVRDWVSPLSAISPESMLFRNTAFPLECMMSSHSDAYFSMILFSHYLNNGVDAPSSCLSQSAMINKSGCLRFCPSCAREQKRLYGEPYWQVLPQVEGVEFCPIHGDKILTTPVAVKAIEHHFHPASAVLAEMGESRCPDKAPEEWTHIVLENREAFIQLARDFMWCFEHAPRTNGLEHIGNGYKAALAGNGMDAHGAQLLEIAMSKLKDSSLSEGLTSLATGILPDQWAQYICHPLETGTFPAWVHILLMRALAGSPRTFYAHTAPE